MCLKIIDMDGQSLDAQQALAAAHLGELKKKAAAATWTPHLEKLMKSWGEKSAGLRFMHDHAAGRWTKFGNQLTLISILITSVSSCASLISASVEDDVAKNVTLYAVGGIGLVATLLQSLKRFYNAEEKAADHNALARQFGSFYRHMVLQMGLSREDRIPSDQLSEYVQREFERLQTEARPLSGEDIAKFRRVFKNSQQSVPDVCETEHVIIVQGDDALVDDD